MAFLSSADKSVKLKFSALSFEIILQFGKMKAFSILREHWSSIMLFFKSLTFAGVSGRNKRVSSVKFFTVPVIIVSFTGLVNKN